MKMLNARVVDGQLDIPAGALPEGVLVTVLVPDVEAPFDLTPEQVSELQQALAEADRGETVDGWELLEELRQG